MYFIDQVEMNNMTINKVEITAVKNEQKNTVASDKLIKAVHGSYVYMLCAS